MMLNPVTRQKLFRIIPGIIVWILGTGMIVHGIQIFIRLRQLKECGLTAGIAAVFIFAGAAFWTGGGLMLFARKYLMERCGSLASGLIYPVTHLDAPVPPLSPIQGKITAGRIEEARSDLLAYIARYPAHASAYLILADLYRRNWNDTDAALETAMSYLDRTPRTPPDDAVRLVLRAADCRTERNETEAARELLLRELGNRSYSAREKKSLTNRLNSLAGTV